MKDRSKRVTYFGYTLAKHTCVNTNQRLYLCRLHKDVIIGEIKLRNLPKSFKFTTVISHTLESVDCYLRVSKRTEVRNIDGYVEYYQQRRK